MLETIAIVLLALWGFGFWGPYRANLGHFVHILILIALVVMVIRIIQGRRVL
jgi:hypothetical protein